MEVVGGIGVTNSKSEVVVPVFYIVQCVLYFLIIIHELAPDGGMKIYWGKG